MSVGYFEEDAKEKQEVAVGGPEADPSPLRQALRTMPLEEAEEALSPQANNWRAARGRGEKADVAMGRKSPNEEEREAWKAAARLLFKFQDDMIGRNGIDVLHASIDTNLFGAASRLEGIARSDPRAATVGRKLRAWGEELKAFKPPKPDKRLASAARKWSRSAHAMGKAYDSSRKKGAAMEKKVARQKGAMEERVEERRALLLAQLATTGRAAWDMVGKTAEAMRGHHQGSFEGALKVIVSALMDASVHEAEENAKYTPDHVREAQEDTFHIEMLAARAAANAEHKDDQ